MKIGIICFQGSMIRLNGVVEAFSETGNKVRLAVWPLHTTDTGIYGTWERNVLLNSHKDGMMQTVRELVPEIDWSKKCFDLNEVRVIDETRNFENLENDEAEKKAGLTAEWVEGCNNVIVDLTGLMEVPPEKAVSILNILIKNIKVPISFYVFDFIPTFSFLRGYMEKSRIKWDSELNKLQEKQLVFCSRSDEIKAAMGTLQETSLSKTLKKIEEIYNRMFFSNFVK